MRRRISFLGATTAGLLAAAGATAARGAQPETPRAQPIYDPYVLFFDSGSAALQPGAVGILENVAQAYAQLPHCGLIVTGHTDRVGSAAYNLRLSRRRAEAVLAWLRRRGLLDPATIESVGEAKPLLETDDGIPAAENRYATVEIQTCLKP